MIEVAGLTKLYDTFVAVEELSFSVRSSEVLGLVGPNGAGKTTTLRCLSGIIPATRGAVRICGHDIAADPIAAKRRDSGAGLPAARWTAPPPPLHLPLRRRA